LAWTVERAPGVDADIEAIFDFILEASLEFGDSRDVALSRAASRARDIEDEIEKLGLVPYQGTITAFSDGSLRHVTKGRAIIYFQLLSEERRITALAVFYGGQDHHRRFLLRQLR
jgi:plasmid stabilization system protein ParE